jgi:hypothetical protein
MRVKKRGRLCLQVGFTVMLSGLVASHLAYAQVDSGTIRGSVRNEAGEGAPGAEVVLKNEDTTHERTTHTRSDGTYIFTPVEAGTYTLTVRLKGFEPATLTGLSVAIGQNVMASFALHGEKAEGETSSSVPSPPGPQARNSYIYGVDTSAGITALPLFSRSYTALAQLFAGVTQPQETHHGLEPGGAFVANGIGFSQNNYLLDGVDNNNRLVDFLTGTSFVTLPAEDAIQEFRVESDANAAVGGAAGALLNTVTKSGTTDFHGRLWEYYGNDKLNAADFFDNANNVSAAALRKNQFGIAVGGPVIIPNFYKRNNKTFFFVDYQGTRMHLGVPQTSTVPTLAERSSGFTDFSDLITAQPGCNRGPDLLGRTVNCGTIFDPATTRLVLAGGVDPVTGRTATATGIVRDPFTGNTLPGTRVDPIAAAILGLFPAPNGAGIYNNYTTNVYRSQNENSFDIRLDHALGPHDAVFARFSYFDAPVRQAGPFTGYADGGGYTQVARSQNGVLSETHTISPNTVNEFRAGYSGLHAARVQPFANILSNIPGLYGIAAIPQVAGNGGLPTIDIGILSPLGSSPFLYTDDFDATVQVVDNVSKVVGAQIWHFGGDARSIKASTIEPAHSRGQFDFSGNYASIPNILDATTGAAQFLLSPTTTNVPNGTNYVGGPNRVQASNITNFEDRRYYLSGYFTDDWRLDPRLTVTLGARYEYFGPAWENFGAEANFIPGAPGNGAQYEIPTSRGSQTLSTFFTNALTSEQIKLVYLARSKLVQAQKTNISPRVGWAYQLTPKLVIRGGGGLYYGGLANQGVLTNLAGNYPFQLNYTFNSPNDGTPIIYPYSGSYATIEQGLVGVTLNPATADPNGMALRSYQTIYKTPYTESARVAASYQLGANRAVEIAYAGSLGRHLPVNPGVNELSLILRPGENPQSFVPFPTFAYNSSFIQSEGSSYYHSGALTFSQRTGHGLSVLANYTYSDTRTDAHDLIFPGGDQPYRAPYVWGIKKDYGWANFDVRHAAHISGSYELPAGKGKRFFANEGILGKVLGDWSLHWILTVQSGQPTTIPCTITTAAGEGCYALLTGSAAGSNSVTQFWNPLAFVNPAVATSTGQSDLSPLGGAPAQAFGPGIKRLDLALHKELKLSEKAHVEFRVEAFNATNHPNFASPSILNFNDPAYFGRISSTRDNPYDPRQIQFALRIYF